MLRPRRGYPCGAALLLTGLIGSDHQGSDIHSSGRRLDFDLSQLLALATPALAATGNGHGGGNNGNNGKGGASGSSGGNNGNGAANSASAG
jgi:hypothetical protein